MLPVDQHIFEFRKQFFKLAGGAFRVYDSSQRLLLFSEQKAFKIREDIRVYDSEAKTNQVLAIRTQQIFDISPTFDIIELPSGEKAGSLKRKGLKSILKVEEDSTLFAILRRFLTNLIPQKYHFVIGTQTVGSFQQAFNPFLYRATMDLTADTGKQLDRRLALAAGILLLAIEGRQD
jgi:uncharacterized protein YxjI